MSIANVNIRFQPLPNVVKFLHCANAAAFAIIALQKVKRRR